MVDKWRDLPEDCIIPRELGCIDFTMNLSKSPMWHVLIGWCKPKGLHAIFIEFNLLINTSTTTIILITPDEFKFSSNFCQLSTTNSFMSLPYLIKHILKGNSVLQFYIWYQVHWSKSETIYENLKDQ